MKYFTLLLLVLGFISCRGPVGPSGRDGRDGSQAGFVYFEGFGANIKCATCHSMDSDTTNLKTARDLEYAVTGHMTGTSWARGLENASCSGCHITEGLIERARGGFTTQATKVYKSGTPPGCFTCHSPHIKGNFAMRDTSAAVIRSFVFGVPNATFDVGQSNMCIRCHTTRETSPMSPIPDPTKTAPTDTIVITSNRFYPHYGVQGQILIGKGGFEFAGFTYNHSYHKTRAENKTIQCSDCHMARPVVIVNGEPASGGHTLKIGYSSIHPDSADNNYNIAGCKTSGCHSDMGTSNTMTSANFLNYRTAQRDVNLLMDTLRAELVAKNWLNPTTDLVNASTTAPLRIAPAYKAGALFNYFFLEHEGSHGIHNTRYAKDLLRASIDVLRRP